MTEKFSPQVNKKLKYYVYLYSHPKTNEIFYIGKGKGNRVFAHLHEKSKSQKSQYIQELLSQDLKPKVEILIHGIEDEQTALSIEAAIIDLVGMNKLTNIQSGYKSKTFGRMSIDQINAIYDSDKKDIDVPSILIRINKAFRYSMSAEELYNYTRGVWRLNPERAKHANYAFAVYHGVIQEVYQIDSWHPAYTTLDKRARLDNEEDYEKLKKRFEFLGKVADNEIRDKYLYKSVSHYFKQGNSNPIMYIGV